MKTNTDQQIKSQLAQRNLNPSENSWAKLSQMMDAEKPQQKTVRFPKWWKMVVAASVAILVAVWAVNPFGENEIEKPQIAIESVPNENIENSIPEKLKSKNEMILEEISSEIVKNEITEPEKTKINSKLNSIKKEEFIVENKTEIAQNQEENIKISEPKLDLILPKVEVPQEIASTDIPEEKPQIEKKKSKYVDADMLLYSIENNQNISESKDNSKLVIIDFNK